MSKKYSIKICGETFQCKYSFPNVKEYCFLDFNKCYSKPSTEKLQAYEYWNKWFYTCPYRDIDKFGIVTYNRYNFKLGGLLNIAGGHFYIEITKCHQYIYCLDYAESEWEANHMFDKYKFPLDVMLLEG